METNICDALFYDFVNKYKDNDIEVRDEDFLSYRRFTYSFYWNNILVNRIRMIITYECINSYNHAIHFNDIQTYLYSYIDSRYGKPIPALDEDLEIIDIKF